MSVKEFFAFPSIKQSVIEFLKVRADFSALDRKFKKPFRAHINKHSTNTQGQQTEMIGGTSSVKDSLLDYFVSDGFHSIKCLFTEACRKQFSETYPDSVTIPSIVNMLICVQRFHLELRSSLASFKRQASQASSMYEESTMDVSGGNLSGIKSLEVVLLVDELRVISFDRYGVKLPSSVAFDD